MLGNGSEQAKIWWAVHKEVRERNELACRALKAEENKEQEIDARQMETVMTNPVFGWWHSFAHELINQLAIDSGFTGVSLGERVYCKARDDKSHGAGVLIYAHQPWSGRDARRADQPGGHGRAAEDSGENAAQDARLLERSALFVQTQEPQEGDWGRMPCMPNEFGDVMLLPEQVPRQKPDSGGARRLRSLGTVELIGSSGSAWAGLHSGDLASMLFEELRIAKQLHTDLLVRCRAQEPRDGKAFRHSCRTAGKPPHEDQHNNK